MAHEMTEELRAECRRRGIRFTLGYTLSGGRRINEYNVTFIWVDDDPANTLSFEEDDGALFCADSMSVAQCIAAATA